MALLRLIKASATGLNIISSPCHFLRTTEPKRRIADVYRDQERSRRGSKAARRGRRGSDSEPARPGPGQEQSNILHYTKRNHMNQPFGLGTPAKEYKQVVRTTDAPDFFFVSAGAPAGRGRKTPVPVRSLLAPGGVRKTARMPAAGCACA
jgi:hypothetical protein